MKISTLLLFLCLFSLMAENVYTQQKEISLDLKNVTIKKAISEIEETSDYVFLITDEAKLELNKRASLRASKESIQSILETLLKDTDMEYIVVERQVLVYKSASPKAVEKPIAIKEEIEQQKKTITGRVTDAGGLPVIGANIVEKGTLNGTVTNADGNFSLQVGNNATIRISYIGYLEQDITTLGQSAFNITLLEDTKALEEVVVVGYGTKLKGELTGAISKADKKIFETRPVTTTLSALQGAMPGVVVTKGSGRPGREGYNFQIRGYSSIAGSSPLVLIDGIAGDLSTINPNDIQSVTVLKDAAASIYGARAADGVLLVTTKKGSGGKPTVSYSGNYGISIPSYLAKKTSTLQMAEMYDEGLRNTGQPGLSQEVFDKIKANAAPDVNKGWAKYLENYPGFYGNTDWYDVIFRNGQQQSHNLSVSGGGENHNYLFSVGYKSNGGMLKHGRDLAELFNIRFNLGFKLFDDRLNVETRTSFDDQIINEPTAINDGSYGFLYYLNEMPSYVPVYNSNGQFYWYQNFGNPAQALEESGKSKTDNHIFRTNIKAELKLLNDLKLITQMGVNLGINDANSYTRTFDLIDWNGKVFGQKNVPNNATYTNSKSLYGSYTAYLEYNKSIKKHQINIMGGASHEQNDYQGQTITGYNFKSNDIFTLNLADRTKTAYANFSGSASDWALNSYFGRLSYSYDRRFFLDFTTRVDGSSKFAASKRWSALFPAVSASWNMSEENFIKQLNIFDILKLRTGWGQAGNQNLSFGNYDYIPLINTSGNYPLGSPNVGLPGMVSSIASESRTWETIETTNAGIDFAVLKSKLTGSFDYFTKHNNNMLVNVTLPATLGGTAPTQNVGKLETKGWDFSLGWNDSKGDFKYAVTVMISDNKTKLLELKGNDNYGEGLVATRKGYPINSYFGYAFDGIIQNQDELNEYKKMGNIPAGISIGDVRYKDLDGDGKITAFGNPDQGYAGDMKYLGDRNPRYTYSSNISLAYKNFELNIFLQGVGKRTVVRTGPISRPLFYIWSVPLEYFYGKTWSPERTDAKYPRIIPGALGYDDLQNWDYRYSENVIDNVAYLRIKNLSIVYNLPKTWCNKLKMQSIRAYASGEDLFTISKGIWDKSFDPEEYQYSTQQSFPFQKVISFGLDVRF